MKKLVLTSILLFTFLNKGFSQDSISVLFIGNSYTYVNDLPTMFTNLTNSLSDIVTVDSKTNGGYTFQQHLADPVTHTKIKSKKWDFVVLQGQSQEPSFPTDQVNSQTLPPAVSLADSVYANWYCSQAMYFMTWGRQNGDPQWDSISTFDGMNVRLRNAYKRIADSAEASVSPVGIAWKYVRDTYPTINLYNADGSHPSVEGTYLAACTFYASLFRKTPVGATFTSGLDPVIAGQLQDAAAIAVLDSLTLWRLRGKEDLTIAQFSSSTAGNSVQFTNQSVHATSYTWDFGDGNTSIDQDPSHTFLSDGNFLVQLIAESECGNDTISSVVQISYWGIEELNADVRIHSIGDGQYRITSETGVLAGFTLVHQQGKVLHMIPENQDEIVVDLRHFSPGIYLIRANNAVRRVVWSGIQE